MVWSSVALLAAAVPLWWILVGYFAQAPTENISFSRVDGWCDPGTQGIGVHCFGDFQPPRQLLDAPSVWAGDGISGGYTPVGLTPHVIAQGLEAAGLGVRGSLVVFLVAMALAMSLPAVFTAFRGASGTRGPLPLLLFFAAAAPALITPDRGNSAGFPIPFMLLFAIYAGRNPRWVAIASIIVAAGIRPQFVLLAVGLLAFRRTKDALLAVAGATSATAISFLLWPGDRAGNIQAWWSHITTYSESVGPNAPKTNLSASCGM